VVTVNDRRKRAMGRKVIDAVGGKTIAVLGLAFKPNADSEVMPGTHPLKVTLPMHSCA